MAAATSDLQYIISVQLTQLEDLRALHSTIMAIQDLTAQGAEFNVGVNATSLETLSTQIDKAVAKGFSRASQRTKVTIERGKADGAGTGGGGGTDTEALVSALTTALQSLPALQQPQVAQPAARGKRAAAETANAENRVQRDSINARIRAIDAALPIFRNIAEGKYTRPDGTAELPQADRAIIEAARAVYKPQTVDPYEIVRRYEASRKAEQKKLNAIPADDPVASRTGRRMSLDAKVLEQAFADGATKLGTALQDAIKAATPDLVAALRAGGGRSDTSDEVDYHLRDKGQTAIAGLRPSGSRNSVAELRNQERVNNYALREVGQRITLAESRLEEERRAGREAAAEQIEKDLAALRVEQTALRKRERELPVLIRDEKGRVGSDRTSFLSAAQQRRAQETIVGDDTGRAAGAAARAAQILRGLTVGEANVALRGAEGGVMTTRTLYDQLLNGRIRKNPDMLGIQGEMNSIDKQLETYRGQLGAATPKDRKDIETKIAQLTEKRTDLEFKKSRTMFDLANRDIAQGVAEYTARLKSRRATGDISSSEFDKKIGALGKGSGAAADMLADTPDLRREYLLIPQAFAQYIRDTLTKYRVALETQLKDGTAVPAELTKEISENVILRRFAAGKTPVRVDRINEFMGRFGKEKTAFETIARREGRVDFPEFNPDLSKETAPFFEEKDQGILYKRDTTPSLQNRAIALAQFANAGGGFAPQTAQRRQYVDAMLLEYEKRNAELKGGEMDRSDRLKWFRLLQEQEFGGRYYDTAKPPKSVVDGVLLSPGRTAFEGSKKTGDYREIELLPNEIQRVRDGGVRSDVMRNPLAEVFDNGALSAEAKTARDLEAALKKVEGSLARVAQTLTQLSQTSFDPVIRQMTAMADSLKPYAGALLEIQQSLAKTSGLMKSLGKVADREMMARIRKNEVWEVEGARSATVRTREEEKRKTVEARTEGTAADEEERRITVEARKKARLAQNRSRTATQRGVEAAKTTGKSDREQLATEAELERMVNRALFGDSMGSLSVLPQMAGLPQMPQTVPGMGTETAVLRDLLIRGRGQIGSTQRRMQELQALYTARSAAGLDTSTTANNIAGTSAKWDANMSSFAVNAQAMAMNTPGFFGRRNSEVLQTTAGLLSTANTRTELGDNIRVIEEASLKVAEIDKRLAGIKGNSPAKDRLRTDLTTARDAATKFTDDRYTDLQSRGLIGANDPRTLDTVRAKYGALNTELAKYYDNLIKATRASIDAAEAGGGFGERVLSKLQNLAAYVTAGGVVYTIASQLRTAASEAVGLEADITRIQGVLSTRSGGEARQIGSGLISAAQEYGVPLRQSVQAGKLFAQTGAGADQTLQLTRASLAAQVGAGIEAGQATELLIAVENITNRQVKAFDIIDRISRIESQYAVTAQDLSASIQRAGSLAMQLQPQATGAIDALDLIIGSATTIIERTRVTGDQAATSLRFILSRLTAPEVARTLQDKFKINLGGDTPDTLRPLQDILQDVATKYKDLKDNGETVKAQQLLTTFAGSRQSNVGAALLAGFDDALKTASESAYAFGDTQERVKLQLSTLESKLAQFNTAFSGFANKLINETFVGDLVKGAVDLGTGLLKKGDSPLAGFVTGGAIVGASGLAELGSTRLRGFSQRASSAAAAAALANSSGQLSLFGGGASATGQALAGRAAGVGATALGGLATTGIYIGGALALVAAMEALTVVFRDRNRIERMREGEKFDAKAFREQPFFQEYTARADNYGLTADELQSRVTNAAVAVKAQVDEELKSGKLQLDQKYNRTVELMTEALSKGTNTALPGFIQLGDKALEAAEALALLKATAKLDLSVPQTIFNDLRTDLSDAVADFAKNSKGLRDRLTSPPGVRPFTGGYEEMRYSGPQPTRADDAINELNKAYSVGSGLSRRTVFDLGKTVFGAVARQAANRGEDPVSAMDTFSRTKLLLAPNMSGTLQRAEDAIRAREGDNVVVTAADRYTEALKEVKNATQDYKDELAKAADIFQRQSDAANVLLGQAKSFFNLDGRLTDNALTGNTQPGSATVSAVGQVVDLALRRLLNEARGRTLTAKESSTKDLLEGIKGSETRLDQAAQLSETRGNVRDRLFNPIVGYATAMADVRIQKDMASKFGLSYDEVAGRGDAARTLLRELNRVPIQLQADIIQRQAKLVNGAEMTRELQLSFDETGGVTPGLKKVLAQTAEGLMGTEQQRKTTVDEITVLQSTVKTVMEKGLNGFIRNAKGSDNEEVKKTAVALEESLMKLASLGTPDTKDKVMTLINTIGGIDELLKKVAELAKNDITGETRRQLKLADIGRGMETERANAQLQASARMALMQSDLVGFQANPLQAASGVSMQRSIFQQTAQDRVAEADRTYKATMERLAEQYANANDPNRVIGEKDALATRDRERNAATGDARNNELQFLTQTQTQLTRRRRDESVQLVQDLTAPLRGFLMSSKNFSREGYQSLIEGIGQAAQARLVDVFMRNMFGETGLLGNTLANAFNKGAISTETAIERGFRVSIELLAAELRKGISINAPNGSAQPAGAASAQGVSPSSSSSSLVPGVDADTVQRVLNAKPVANLASTGGMELVAGMLNDPPPKGTKQTDPYAPQIWSQGPVPRDATMTPAVWQKQQRDEYLRRMAAATIGAAPQRLSVPEPSLLQKSVTLGASMLPPVDVPELVRGAKQIAGGGVEAGTKTIGTELALAGSLAFLPAGLRKAAKTGVVTEDAVRATNRLRSSSLFVPTLSQLDRLNAHFALQGLDPSWRALENSRVARPVEHSSSSVIDAVRVEPNLQGSGTGDTWQGTGFYATGLTSKYVNGAWDMSPVSAYYRGVAENKGGAGYVMPSVRTMQGVAIREGVLTRLGNSYGRYHPTLTRFETSAARVPPRHMEDYPEWQYENALYDNDELDRELLPEAMRRSHSGYYQDSARLRRVFDRVFTYPDLLRAGTPVAASDMRLVNSAMGFVKAAPADIGSDIDRLAYSISNPGMLDARTLGSADLVNGGGLYGAPMKEVLRAERLAELSLNKRARRDALDNIPSFDPRIPLEWAKSNAATYRGTFFANDDELFNMQLPFWNQPASQRIIPALEEVFGKDRVEKRRIWDSYNGNLREPLKDYQQNESILRYADFKETDNIFVDDESAWKVMLSLRDKGIVGNQYYTRGTAEDLAAGRDISKTASYNYVVTDPSRIRLEQVFGLAGGFGLAGYAARTGGLGVGSGNRDRDTRNVSLTDLLPASANPNLRKGSGGLQYLDSPSFMDLPFAPGNGMRQGGSTIFDVWRMQQEAIGKGDSTLYGAGANDLPQYLPKDYFSPEQQERLRRQGVKSLENVYYSSAGILNYDPKRKTSAEKVSSHMVFAAAPLLPGETFDEAEVRAKSNKYQLLPSVTGEASLDTLDPMARPYVDELLSRVRGLGMKAKVREASRPLQNNLKYFGEGKSWTLTSRHAMGTAVDLTTSSDYEEIRQFIESDPRLSKIFNREIQGDQVHFEVSTEALLGQLEEEYRAGNNKADLSFLNRKDTLRGPFNLPTNSVLGSVLSPLVPDTTSRFSSAIGSVKAPVGMYPTLDSLFSNMRPISREPLKQSAFSLRALGEPFQPSTRPAQSIDYRDYPTIMTQSRTPSVFGSVKAPVGFYPQLDSIFGNLTPISQEPLKQSAFSLRSLGDPRGFPSAAAAPVTSAAAQFVSSYGTVKAPVGFYPQLDSIFGNMRPISREPIVPGAFSLRALGDPRGLASVGTVTAAGVSTGKSDVSFLFRKAGEPLTGPFGYGGDLADMRSIGPFNRAKEVADEAVRRGKLYAADPKLSARARELYASGQRRGFELYGNPDVRLPDMGIFAPAYQFGGTPTQLAPMVVNAKRPAAARSGAARPAANASADLRTQPHTQFGAAIMAGLNKTFLGSSNLTSSLTSPVTLPPLLASAVTDPASVPQLTPEQLYEQKVQAAMERRKQQDEQAKIDAEAMQRLGLKQNKQFSFEAKYGKWGRAADVALPLAGSLIGQELGQRTGVNDGNNFAQEGASIGGLIGGATPLGPVGAFIGATLGGFVGGRFGKGPKEDERQLTALDAIERNTRQQIQTIENQTQLLQLDSRFLNVPTGFVVPEFRPFGVGTGGERGANVTMNITVNGAPGQSESELANMVASAIRNELRGAGGAFDIRR